MSIAQQARSAYATNNVATASQQQLLLQLMDRLVLDVERGVRAQMTRDFSSAGSQFVHAQAILTELQSTLVVEGWTGGRELMALYDYLQRRLVQANVRKDQRAAKEVHAHCKALRDTWYKAAQLIAQGK